MASARRYTDEEYGRTRANDRDESCSRPLLITLAAGPVHAERGEDLQATWHGAFVLTRTPLFSECSITSPTTASPVAAWVRQEPALLPGEIATIDKVEVTWTRIDVSLTFLEPFRVTWKDGPYTLYDQHRCRVQLNMDLPRDVRKDATKASAAIAAMLQSFPSEALARHAAEYNKRKVEAYPAGWERTKAEYETWRVTHLNARIQEKIDTLLRESQDALDRGHDDDEYLKCFGKGARTRSYQSFGSCDSLLNDYFLSSGSCDNQRGYDDGERMADARHRTRPRSLPRTGGRRRDQLNRLNGLKQTMHSLRSTTTSACSSRRPSSAGNRILDRGIGVVVDLEAADLGVPTVPDRSSLYFPIYDEGCRTAPSSTRWPTWAPAWFIRATACCRTAGWDSTARP